MGFRVRTVIATRRRDRERKFCGKSGVHCILIMSHWELIVLGSILCACGGVCVGGVG